MATFVTFTRFSVKVGESFVSVRPVISADGQVQGKTTLMGSLIDLSSTMRVITASEHGTLASKTKTGSVHRIAARNVVGKPETLKSLLKRNPWNNPNAKLLAKALV